MLWQSQALRTVTKIKLIFQDQIRLSPFDPSKAINILTDGASSKGIGFMFYQHPDESNPSDDVTIVQANSSALKDSQLGYSLVDCESPCT